MSGTPIPKNSIGNALKLYLFPSVVTILSMMIWRDVTELRSDVKALLAQSNIDKTEIQNLKREVFKMPPTATTSTDVDRMYVVHDQYFKHEDFYDITKYVPKTEL